MYTDDVKLYSEIVSDDGRTRLQENLEALTDWELSISSQKYFILHWDT